MVDKDTLSYKKGFAKGIEIYTENLSKSGYDADEDNKRCVKAFKHYADTGFKKGNLDMSLPKNLYPKDFQRWHDIRIDEYHTAKALKDAEEKRKYMVKFIDVAKKYMPLQRNMKEPFICIIAKSPDDLVKEGEFLNHCVGHMNYDQRMAKEQSLIFFIRKPSEPDKPFVTVEYSLENHKVLQCQGNNHSKPADEVLEYVNKKWLPYANRKLKKLAA